MLLGVLTRSQGQCIVWNVPGPSPFQQPDDTSHDLGPWIESPSSTRVSRYRYDYAEGSLQVQWTNGKNDGYVYRGLDRSTYQRFARAVSKGQMINRVLNGFPYERMTPEEVTAPSNPNRQALSSRVVQ